MKKTFIKRQINKYLLLRKNAVLEEREENYVLRDRINDLPEFRTWVRSFGTNARIIKPKELKEMVLQDILEMLKKYGGDSNV